MRILEQEPKLLLVSNSAQHRLLDQNLSPPKECGECSTPGNLILKEIKERNTFWSSSKYNQQWKDLEEFTQYLLASVVLSIFLCTQQTQRKSETVILQMFFLMARPLNLAAMSDLRSGV